MTDFSTIRRALANFASDHDAAGSQQPDVKDIFTPEQHANALDPNTPVVIGARGAGKSFWAGVLGNSETRIVAANAYPNLQLGNLIVKLGYNGLDIEGAVDPKIINARVPFGEEIGIANQFWSAVIVRAAQAALAPEQEDSSIRKIMDNYADPEDFSEEIKRVDRELEKAGKTLLVIFDALDTLSNDWKRSSRLLDALFEVIWSLRARKCIRAKLFIRPEQLADDGLRFIELPKLRSGGIELKWSQTELYGLLFWRLRNVFEDSDSFFAKLANQVGSPYITTEENPRNWRLLINPEIQKRMMALLAGPYMGANAKRGGTYDWPYNHLADARSNVTPRSFIQLFAGAAKFGEQLDKYAISAKGIQEGLRTASKVRVDELVTEYKWIKRALLPLAGLIVPCNIEAIYEKWKKSDTIETILKTAVVPNQEFMPPFPLTSQGDKNSLLAKEMERIGVFSFRVDERVDMPDLFRVAAQMLKKGGISGKL